MRANLRWIFCSFLYRVTCVGSNMSLYHSLSLRSLLISEVPITFKSAHQVLSVSPSKAGHQQTAALSCNCAIFAGVFYLNRCTHQKLESLLNSHSTCWSFSPFTGPKGHFLTWKSKRGHDITYLLNDLNRRVSHTHTRWPSLFLLSTCAHMVFVLSSLWGRC